MDAIWRSFSTTGEQVATMIEENRLQRFPFRLGTFLFVVAILALFLVVVIQQVQIGRQQVQIRQLRQNVDRIPIEIFRFIEATRRTHGARSRDNRLRPSLWGNRNLNHERARHGREKSGTENNAVEIKTGLVPNAKAIASDNETDLIRILVDVDLSGGRSRL